MKLQQFIIKFVITFAFLLLAGCGSLDVLEPRADTSQFYVLGYTDKSPGPALGDRQLAIAIGPATLARHLDQPQIVRYRENNKVAYAERDRWAEPLEDNINRVLVLCLGDTLDTSQIGLLSMMGSAKTDYRVGYHVYRYGARADETVELQVAWWIESVSGERLVFTEQSYTIPDGGSANTSAYVKALQQVVVNWAKDVAERIESIEETNKS